jgi:L-fuculose-phosphate aldolase
VNASVTLPELQREVVRACRAVHGRGWCANHEGNVTALTAEGKVLATPTAVSKGDVRESDLLLLDRFGRKVAGSRKPFSELSMHLAVYQSRPDVGAVVHAHPPRATAFASAGRAIEARFLPEFVVSIGGAVPVVPFALPGSESLVKALQPVLEEFDVVLLASHGVLAWGPDVSTALLRIEHAEEAAEVLLHAAALGGAKPIPDELHRLLLDARTKAGLGPSGRARAKARPR